MVIKIVQENELKIASGLSRYVFDHCLRNRMEFPQTIEYVENYIAEENLKKFCQEGKLIIWGVYEGEHLVAVSGLQSDGLITLLYVLPQCQNRGYGSQLLIAMREYAKETLGFSKVTVNANPAWTSFFFKKKGFSNVDSNQNLRAPFVPMYALSNSIGGFEKRPVSKIVIAVAIAVCILFATIAGSLFMISYLF